MAFIAQIWARENLSKQVCHRRLLNSSKIRRFGCPKTVQKNFKKLLTPLPPFGIVTSHTVKNNKKMRTKTLLLSAAALVAGALASQAQSNVYSANVVGYANVVIQGNGQFTLVANPFDDGKGNVMYQCS